MRIKSSFLLLPLVALVNANNYRFNVVSIYGEGSQLGVKYGNIVKPLTASPFPLFTGDVVADDIKEYKYVSLNSVGEVIEEESITRTYSDDTSKINEVYNRTTKKVNIPELPKPFKDMFPMGTEKYKPFPNEIYNIYAKCDEYPYGILTVDPFLKTYELPGKSANCTITIISPENTFQSAGAVHLIGYGSRLFKKLSWNMKFEKKFMGRKAIKLRAMAYDASLMREKFASAIFKAAGVPVQECTYARLFINGDRYGLYSMVDNLNSKWIKNYIHGNSKAQIGFSYRLDSAHPKGPFADLRYHGDNYTVYENFYTYKVDEYEGKKTKPLNKATQYNLLIQFIKLYNTWTITYANDFSEKAVTELEKFLNLESLLRLIAVESLLMAADNFYIVNSNTELYYNTEKNYYQFLPFDFDNAMYGPSDNILIKPVGYLEDCLTWVNYDEGKFEHYFTNHLFKHPQIKDRYNVILAKISNYPFHKDVVHQYIRAVTDLIQEDVQWNFKLQDELSIGYGGIQRHYTLTDFENNLVNRNLDLSAFRNENGTRIDFMQFLEMRGDKCRDFTASVDLSKEMSKEYDISLTEEDLILTKSGSLSTFHWNGMMVVVLLSSLFLTYFQHY
ncbi:hypothetical protein PIROE2DRAFT_14660 [Piromyces sp. E2]|nr:hypothetical protein PIROE2DRAFT_14660 [Piromyces sp. E2]|eukprot:OUM59723.1 hypothetical protein PIROE2DRAFT_14660 [Piromyces sp. E2]